MLLISLDTSAVFMWYCIIWGSGRFWNTAGLSLVNRLQSVKIITAWHIQMDCNYWTDLNVFHILSSQFIDISPHAILQTQDMRFLICWSKYNCCPIFRCVRKIAKKRPLVSSCLSVRPYGTTRLPLGVFSWNLILEYFSEYCWENSSFIKIGQE